MNLSHSGCVIHCEYILVETGRRIIMLSLDEFVKLGYDEEDYDDYVNYMHECRGTYVEDEDEEE